MTRPGRPRQTPPLLATRILAATLPDAEREALLGDLEETYAHRWQTDGALRAAVWYWSQVIAAPARVAYEGRIDRSTPTTSSARSRSIAGATQAFANDMRLGARRACQRPGPILTSITLLSLAVGGSTALVATLDSFTRWSPGLPAPEQISALAFESGTRTTGRIPYERALRLAEAVPELPTTSVGHRHVVVRSESGATTVLAALVTPAFFDVVDAPIARGRPPASDGEVVVSDRFRRRRLASRERVLGTSLWINGAPHTIVGVTAAGFRGLSGQPSLWVSPAALPAAERGAASVTLLACRCDHPDLDATATRLTSVLESEDGGGEIEARWQPAAEVWVPSGESDLIHRANLTVATLALLVLAAACANVANLLLADGLERRSEFAVRAAIGASRGRLWRQLLVESTTLAAAVCAGSYLVAIGTLAAVPHWLPTPIPGFERRVELPAWLLAGGIGLAIIVTLVATMLPAWRVASAHGGHLSARSPGSRRGRVLEMLGVAQLTAASSLTLIALMVGGAMDEVHDQPLGYEENGRYSFTLDASAVPDDATARAGAYRRFFAELAAQPAVVAAGISGAVPGFLGPYTAVRDRPGADAVMAGAMGVGDGYLDAAGTQLREGRALRAEDAGSDVALISASLARALWASASAVGRTLRIGEEGNPLRVVGVIEDGTYAGREILPVVLWPLPPPRAGRALVIVYGRNGAANLNGAIQAALRAAHPDLSVHSLAPVGEWFDRHWLLTRAVGAILRTLAALGLLISGAGIHAGFATMVTRRRHELGVRMSLGATPAGLRRWVITRAAWVVAWGYAIGALVAAAGSRLVQAYIFGSGPWDPLVHAAGIAITALLAVVASLTPALRAARTDPVRSLRTS